MCAIPALGPSVGRFARPIASNGVHVITELDPAPWPGERTVVTIGAYDGVHLGHQAVIDQVRAIASESAARSVVLTFDRHPAMVVRPESAPQLLTDPEQRLELLAATGIDATVVLPFDEEQSHESPESFVHRVLVRGHTCARWWSARTSTSVPTAAVTSICSRSSDVRTTSRSVRSS